ncbi:methylated-DNA--[protein]-cysteine S-methyltransferase [Raineyella fluvialis]|uniref:Methylated-DNA--[protein]-cysteine S-methyltransferase n=1 Tax=Raineyella fluvialis TaxID=2662261 RepID=A0A5Q2FF29_9ACTN|nr:methylated-DNA--[protein]-cysteine S-methyltransferase [Raineyella fluvialis]QGF23713.1 methylated-DNA--[protein]-cysteine S-methyltransferase [Raineyella fluvialis]
MTTTRSLEATTLATPFGAFTAFWTPDDEVLRACGFGELTDIAQVLPRGARRLPVHPNDGDSAIRRAVADVLDGDLTGFASLRTSQPGTPFRQSCWSFLRSSGPGEVLTYRELAERAGRPRAVRVATAACTRNRLAWVVPCHRAVRSAGGLGDYRYGVEIKAALLDWESDHH